MTRLTLAAAATLLAGCTATPAPQGAEAGLDAVRTLRVAAAAERGGQLGVALSIYAAAAAADPGDAAVAARYATALLRAGQPREARDALAEARRRHPGGAALLQAEARALLELGEAAPALALFEQHLQAAPADARSLNGRGVALDLLGRHAEARLAYRAARAAEPRNAVAAGNLALSLLLSGCADAALALLQATPRDAATAEWLGEMQSLARTLAAGSGTEASALRGALPPAAEPCPAAA